MRAVALVLAGWLAVSVLAAYLIGRMARGLPMFGPVRRVASAPGILAATCAGAALLVAGLTATPVDNQAPPEGEATGLVPVLPPALGAVQPSPGARSRDGDDGGGAGDGAVLAAAPATIPVSVPVSAPVSVAPAEEIVSGERRREGGGVDRNPSTPQPAPAPPSPSPPATAAPQPAPSAPPAPAPVSSAGGNPSVSLPAVAAAGGGRSDGPKVDGGDGKDKWHEESNDAKGKVSRAVTAGSEKGEGQERARGRAREKAGKSRGRRG